MPRVTYTTSGASDELNRQFEAAVDAVRSELGGLYPNIIQGSVSSSKARAAVRSPIDTRILVGQTQPGTIEDAARAVEAADRAFRPWRDRGWKERAAVLLEAARLIAERKYRFAAFMAFETGKNRLEAMGEVEESIDLVKYYCMQMDRARGYSRPMGQLAKSEKTLSIYRPFGPWAVISPFNFPLALAIGMIGAALLTGNTVVFKPSQEAPITGYLLYQAMRDAGVPQGVLHFVAGSGNEVGRALVEHPLTQGVAFTGSYEVGMHIYKTFSKDHPRPVVIEMGGKNPAIVMESADLDAAAEGVMRSAFGFGGQKCSACSRVYVEGSVKAHFLEKLLEKTKSIWVGNPLTDGVFLGPVINRKARDKYQRYVASIEAEKGVIHAGGRVLKTDDLSYGHYVEPTVAEMKDDASGLFFEEMFVPILLVAEVKDLDHALMLANRSDYGLTAGLFTQDEIEIEKFLERIEAGVLYVNRKAGATTGAWPGVNSFGGWKASGSTGPAALGPHYLLRFMREQSRTLNAR